MFQVCCDIDDSSFWTKSLQPWKRSFHKEQRMQGNIKMPVPVGINKDTDASVEPRRWDLFFLAGSITRKKEESQKGQSKTKSSLVQIQKSKAFQKSCLINITRL